MSAHTPGPWKLYGRVGQHEEGDYLIKAADGTFVTEAKVWAGNRHRTDAEVDANARLIAAAPDLLEALAELTNRVDPGVKDRDLGITSLVNALKKARAAIAKAEGK